MKTDTKTGNDYHLKGNPIVQIPVPVIGNLIFDESGQELTARLNETFRGNPNIADSTQYQKDQPISFSNTPRALFYNQKARELTNNRIRLLSPEEVIRYWDSIPERGLTYSDTDAVAAFPNIGPNEDLKKRALEIAGINKIEVPYLISGLGVEPADNEIGFTFTETDYITAREAPFLKEDQRVSYDPEKGLIPSEDGVSIWTSNDQSGLRGACRFGGGGLDFRGGWLLDSGSSGRVQLISGEAAEKNLEAALNNLKAERDKQVAEIDERYKRAKKVLRTGKL